ncbi:MAG: GNAT family N-acetyltransferase [Phycisphaerae bacterium]|nr:GNAT family N-acetyltransferase [Phycisphaerae bacterium]
MAANPDLNKRTVPACRLMPFQPGYAELVLSWVCDPREAYWLAPRTRPPLTAAEVLNWQVPGHQAFLLAERGRAEPIGYGELNVLFGAPRRYWLGHLIVDPARRGQGCGVQLTRLLLWHAFARHGAREVTLVVFPENERAIAAYRAAGMRASGYETHKFSAYERQVRLLRMTATGSA